MFKGFKIWVLLVAIFNMNFAYALRCEIPFIRKRFKQVFQNDVKSMQMEEALEKGRKLVNKLKSKPRKKKIIGVEEKMTNKIAQHELKILSGKKKDAMDEWADLFFQVESSFIIVSKYNRIIRVIRKATSNGATNLVAIIDGSSLPSYLKREVKQQVKAYALVEDYMRDVRKVVRKYEKRLGNKYYEYVRVKGHLDGLMRGEKCNKACQSKINEFVKEIQDITKRRVKSLPEQYQSRQAIPHYTKVKAYIESSPAARNIYKRKELINNAIAVLQPYLRKLMYATNFSTFLARKLGGSSSPLGRVFKNYYNRMAVHQVSKHNELTRSTESIAKKFETVKHQSENNSAYLVNLKRRTDEFSVKTWSELEKHAAKVDADFLKKMESVDKLAKRLGDITNRFSKGGPDAVIAALLVGGGFYGYHWFSTEGEREISGNDDLVEIVERTVDEVRERVPGIEITSSDDDVQEVEEDDGVQVITHYEKDLDKAVLDTLQNVLGEIDEFEEQNSNSND
jgi:hypothetical protein